MPVRKIPKNYLSVTGGFPSQKNGRMLGFESLLEKEHMLLLEFDDAVDHFEEQPVSIPIPGKSKPYTPDVLIHFRPTQQCPTAARPLLVEVKHTDDLAKNDEKYALKFEAATAYAENNGWEFRVVTEKNIRTPRLSNLKFLREFRNVYFDEAEATHVLELFRFHGGTLTFQEAIQSLHSEAKDALHWIPIIWHLVIDRRLMADLDTPLTDSIPLWLP